MLGHWRLPFHQQHDPQVQPHPIPPGVPLIELRQVLKSFATGAGEFVALNGIDLTINAGEFVAIVGKSGSGKSTLINMITGIDRPTAGEVWVAGTPVHTLTEEQIAHWRGQTIGVIFQFFQLLPTLTAVENVMLPMDYGERFVIQERPARALQLLALVGMAEQAHQLPAVLSGGQLQSVAIARALANDPPILVADEPTGNLDSKTAGLILQLFEKLVAQGKTILMVTHDKELSAHAHRIVTLADGRIVPPTQLPGGNGATTPLRIKMSTESAAISPEQVPTGRCSTSDSGDRLWIILGAGKVAKEQGLDVQPEWLQPLSPTAPADH